MSLCWTEGASSSWIKSTKLDGTSPLCPSSSSPEDTIRMQLVLWSRGKVQDVIKKKTKHLFKKRPDLHKSHPRPLFRKYKGTSQPPGGALPQDAHWVHHKDCNYSKKKTNELASKVHTFLLQLFSIWVCFISNTTNIICMSRKTICRALLWKYKVFFLFYYIWLFANMRGLKRVWVESFGPVSQICVLEDSNYFLCWQVIFFSSRNTESHLRPQRCERKQITEQDFQFSARDFPPPLF